jgi:hypothetical protein
MHLPCKIILKSSSQRKKYSEALFVRSPMHLPFFERYVTVNEIEDQ